MVRTSVYDKEELLRRATQLFWERGFAGTSVDDVVQATGVSRSSLYNAFPDKDALFLASLEHYLETVTRSKLERLAHGERAAPAIRRFLMGIAGERPPAGAPAHGCLLTNTAVEIGAGQAKVAECVRGAFGRLEQALAGRIEEARQQGDLATGTDVRQLARQLVAGSGPQGDNQAGHGAPCGARCGSIGAGAAASIRRHGIRIGNDGV